MKNSTNITFRNENAIRSSGSDFFKPKPAKVKLLDGTTFNGYIPEWQPDGTVGEVVFNTGMTGYTETLTDPSYAGQILTFTYPLIGNYGVAESDSWESEGTHVRGVVTSELCHTWSHATGEGSLLTFLKQASVPVIWGVDTRALTKHLRGAGTMAGVITSTDDVFDYKVTIPKVSPKQPFASGAGAKTIIAVDCGAKESIITNLKALGARVIRVPYDFDYTRANFDAVLLSNGPGDPTDYPETIAITKRAMIIGKPIFGICLGSQLMALAAGAQTYKLPYGHRGHNQPVLSESGQAFITSQNHGYAIKESSLPNDWVVTFRNLNDNSVEGISHESKPYFAVQFHPEASPGPTDTSWLFDRLRRVMQ